MSPYITKILALLTKPTNILHVVVLCHLQTHLSQLTAHRNLKPCPRDTL